MAKNVRGNAQQLGQGQSVDFRSGLIADAISKGLFQYEDKIRSEINLKRAQMGASRLQHYKVWGGASAFVGLHTTKSGETKELNFISGWSFDKERGMVKFQGNFITYETASQSGNSKGLEPFNFEGGKKQFALYRSKTNPQNSFLGCVIEIFYDRSGCSVTENALLNLVTGRIVLQKTGFVLSLAGRQEVISYVNNVLKQQGQPSLSMNEIYSYDDLGAVTRVSNIGKNNN